MSLLAFSQKRRELEKPTNAQLKLKSSVCAESGYIIVLLKSCNSLQQLNVMKRTIICKCKKFFLFLLTVKYEVNKKVFVRLVNRLVKTKQD